MNIQQLLRLISQQDVSSTVAELQNGRGSKLPAVTEIDQQLDPEQHDVMNPSIRKKKRVVVDEDDNDYATEDLPDGVDPLAGRVYRDGTTGEKVRWEEVCRLPVSFQDLIVDRAVSFCFGLPVKLNATPAEGTQEADVLNAVDKILGQAKTRSINRDVARSIFSYTEGAELWYVVESPTTAYGFPSKYKLRCQVLKPSKHMSLYPYFDETGDMIAFSREYDITDNHQVTTKYFETWTDSQHFLWRSGDTGSWEVVEGYPRPNVIGKIPVIYGRQDKPEWYNVQRLIERLEDMLSNRGDTNDYHSNPKIKVKGTINSWAKKGDKNAIIELDEGADAEYMTWNQAPESSKQEYENLKSLIYILTQTPDISFESMRGLGQLSGTALRTLFMDAHLKVARKRDIFDDYLQRRVSVILAYLRLMNPEAGFVAACNSILIEPEIVPYMINDESANIVLLTQATGGKAVMSQRTAIERAGYVDDVDQEQAQIQAEEAFGMTSVMGNALEEGEGAE